PLASRPGIPPAAKALTRPLARCDRPGENPRLSALGLNGSSNTKESPMLSEELFFCYFCFFVYDCFGGVLVVLF
ncbi:MAG TPA: hypothetical protein PLG97_08270, partial [Alcaligenes sp.]|nr:hypothetical protein [Alcaligenes sp.]HRL27499.1 hypothetical protein [Alcaligenes sp.]